MPRILLAEDDDAVRNMLQTALGRDDFDVVAVAGVREALRCIAMENFDVLLSDLHMPHAGDGFTVVSTMRHTHPDAVTLVLSGYPELDEALSAIRSQADAVLVKPIEITSLREVIRDKLANRVRHKPSSSESVASLLPDREHLGSVSGKEYCVSVHYLTRKTKAKPGQKDLQNAAARRMQNTT